MDQGKARQGINQLVRYDPGPGGGVAQRQQQRIKYTVVSGVRTVGIRGGKLITLLPPPCARLVVLLFSLYRRNSPVRCTVSYYSK
jgi:hypothetical protein